MAGIHTTKIKATCDPFCDELIQVHTRTDMKRIERLDSERVKGEPLDASELAVA